MLVSLTGEYVRQIGNRFCQCEGDKDKTKLKATTDFVVELPGGLCFVSVKEELSSKWNHLISPNKSTSCFTQEVWIVYPP